jgi:hypothetical protein
MKNSKQLTAIKVASISALLSGAVLAQSGGTIPAIPVGSLSAYPTIVQTGTKPTLTWAATYPSVVQNYVEIIAPSTLKLKKALDVQIRVLGNGVTASSSASSNTFTWVDAEAQLSFKNASYSRIFYGKNTNINPGTVVWSRTKLQTAKDNTLRFGGRYYYNNQWATTFTTSSSGSGSNNVRTLVNGQTPPTITPMHTAPSLESFIKPYLDANGKVKIGPMDVIVFMELTHTNVNDPGYDLQDMVLLVTFTDNTASN